MEEKQKMKRMKIRVNTPNIKIPKPKIDVDDAKLFISVGGKILSFIVVSIVFFTVMIPSLDMALSAPMINNPANEPIPIPTRNISVEQGTDNTHTVDADYNVDKFYIT